MVRADRGIVLQPCRSGLWFVSEAIGRMCMRLSPMSIMIVAGVLIAPVPQKAAAAPVTIATASNAGSTARAASGFQGTPPSAIVHVIRGFIWGMSV
jgi:hypothetical protein